MNVATTAQGRSGERVGGYSVLIVDALQPHAGKTALAAALALKLAYEGRRMLALRLSGDEGDAAAAEADATVYRALPFARGRGGKAVSASDAEEAGRRQAQNGGLLVLEAPEGADLAALATQFNAGVIVALRSADAGTMQSLGTLASQLGPRLLGVVAMAVPRSLHDAAQAALAAGPTPILAVIPEDATLYAPSVLEIAEALDAEVVLGEPSESQIIEHLLIGPISVDPGQPYYARSRSKRAILTRSDKPDQQLAAMHTDVDCLILTGGLNPSPYTIDRAADNEISVLLTNADTRGAVSLLEDIFLKTRFAGEEKLERMGALLDERFDWGTLRGALGAG